MKYQVILLDADNTLLDFDACEHKAFFCAMQDLGMDATDALYDTYNAINAQCWKELEKGIISKNELKVLRYQRLFDHFSLSANPETANDRYIFHLSQTSILIPGALEFVKELARHAKLYIVTNGFAEVQAGRFQNNPMIPYFEDIFISEKVGYAKPDVRFFEAVFRKIPACDKEKTLVIGDSLTSDIQGANNMGLDCIWYNPKKQPAPDHLSIDYTASDFEGILQYLKQGEIHEN